MTRTKLLVQALESRILVLDGAMGTAIQSKNLSASDFGGAQYEGCNEYLVLTKPDVICEIHESYLKAGCDIIETNTFGGTPLVLEEYGLGGRAYEINFTAAKLAQECAQKYSTNDKPRFVAGSIGPTTKAISVTGGVTFDELVGHFYTQAKGLADGGVDYFLLETCQDTRNVKAALTAIDKLLAEGKLLGASLQQGPSRPLGLPSAGLPIAVSGTIEPMGTMLAGQSVEALNAALSHRDLLYIGLNCATGPEFMTDHIRTLAKLSKFRVACVPNAGLPDENGCYLETPEMLKAVLQRFISNGWMNLIGGCCGTEPGHIAALVELAQSGKPRKPQPVKASCLSGVDYLEVTDEMRPIIVGERTNVIGSKKFKTLITESKFDEASEVARAQIKNGAQIVDICLANPDRNELEDMQKFLEVTVKKIRVPIMIDSTDDKVTAIALTYCQGKAIINSINLEDGEERYDKIIPLAKQYGAALVVGTIDDDPNQGMGITRERKLSIAERSYKILTEKWKINPEDIYWDPLVFPCATGDAQYTGSAIETIEGIRLIKQKFPGTKTILGISNVSFGLPSAGREVLNSVFLYHCVQAGLDLAIVNSEKLERYPSIPEEERKLSEDLLFNRGADPIAAFAAHFREKKVEAKTNKNTLPLLERLPRYIIEGSKDGLISDLDEALKTMKPLQIINGPLMKGMDEVGRLFNKNELIVAEVLQSAEAMKAAVLHLEPFMEKADSSNRGKVILATVKGDVHDIGKNLVEIIFSNNGFSVINLGIKVPPEQLIAAAREHNPDIIGLSGLLVKSAQQMALTAADFSKAGVKKPVLVGGAALSENFVDRQIAPVYEGTVAYAPDAMAGLDLAKQIVDEQGFEKLKSNLSTRRAEKAKVNATTAAPAVASSVRSAEIMPLKEFPQPPDFKKHIIRATPIDQIWSYINPLMLYGRHLGLKGGVVRQLEKAVHDLDLARELEKKEARPYAIWKIVQEIKEEFRSTEIMQPCAVFQFFKVASSQNKLFVFAENSSPESEPLVTFDFPRQNREAGLCLSDYVQSLSDAKASSKLQDNMALFVTSVGKGVRELSTLLKNQGNYLRSHIVQALAIESSEGYAELLHAQIRHAWGFPDPFEMTMMQRFQAKYRGRRYSFGYPACPRLDDQAPLFEVLKPEDIGVQLTEGFMMDPEASVSAIVFHHPQATYFGVNDSRSEDEKIE